MTDEQFLSCWRAGFRDARLCLEEFVAQERNLRLCVQFSQMVISALKLEGRIFTCGNGGSHCDAMHFAEELTGRYRKDRKPLGALALGDPSHITCVSNDYGFEHIFSRQLGGLGRSGDLLIGFSTSGRSKNVIRAFEVARSMGIQTVALLGRDGGSLKEMADLSILVPGSTSDRIQEMHIKLVHLVIETLERELFPAHYE